MFGLTVFDKKSPVSFSLVCVLVFLLSMSSSSSLFLYYLIIFLFNVSFQQFCFSFPSYGFLCIYYPDVFTASWFCGFISVITFKRSLFVIFKIGLLPQTFSLFLFDHMILPHRLLSLQFFNSFHLRFTLGNFCYLFSSVFISSFTLLIVIIFSSFYR